jgi:hypothetical protein
VGQSLPPHPNNRISLKIFCQPFGWRLTMKAKFNFQTNRTIYFTTLAKKAVFGLNMSIWFMPVKAEAQ